MASAASTDPFYLVKDDIQASVSRPVMCLGVTGRCSLMLNWCLYWWTLTSTIEMAFSGNTVFPVIVTSLR